MINENCSEREKFALIPHPSSLIESIAHIQNLNKISTGSTFLFKDTLFQNDSKTGINSIHSIAIIQIEQPKPSQ